MDLKVQYGPRIIEGDVSDVRTDLNKSKKKKKNNKERDGDVATAEDTHGDDHDAIMVDDVKTKMTRLDGSEEMSVADVGATAKKNKAKDVQLNSEIKLENKHQVLSEKKQRYEASEGENGRNMETEAVRKKECRKRKHERVADGELEDRRKLSNQRKRSYNQ